jgi:hypothetical protein
MQRWRWSNKMQRNNQLEQTRGERETDTQGVGRQEAEEEEN